MLFEGQQQSTKSASPPSESQEHVGFLQLDRLNYEKVTGFSPDKPFVVEVWFTNRGSFPVYDAQGYVQLVCTSTVVTIGDARIHRNVRKLARKEWETQPTSQVAVGGSIYFQGAVGLTDEEINGIFSGKNKLYLFTMARWKTLSGMRVVTEIDECSFLQQPPSRDFNPIKLEWRACDAAPILAVSNAEQIRSIDELREIGREMLGAPAGQLPAKDRVVRWFERTQLYLRANLPEYVKEFDQCMKEPWANEESKAWADDMERQVEGRQLAAAVEFLDLIREELYSKLP